MTLPYNVYITEEDVLSKGYNLSNTLQQDDQGTIENTIRAFLEEVCGVVFDLIVETISTFGRIPFLLGMTDVEYAKLLQGEGSIWQAAITYAQLNQAIYVLENGNLRASAGEGTGINIKDIREMGYSPSAIAMIREPLLNFLESNFGGGIY